jgi:hypothetical protein
MVVARPDLSRGCSHKKMGVHMKWTRLLALAVALLAWGASTLADTIDPAIGVKGGGTGSTLWTGFTTVVFLPGQTGVSCAGGTCSYTTPSSNPFFINTGSITDFAYAFSQSQSTGFSVAPGSVFPILTVINGVSSAMPLAFLSGGTILPAPTCTICAFASTSSNTVFGDFLLQMGGVNQGTVAVVASNIPIPPVPEPAPILLLGSGLGALALFRRRRNNEAA